VSFFKTCAAILSQILLLQTGCDLWCPHAESEQPPLLASGVTLAGDCHGTPVQKNDGESKPTRHDRSGPDCDHPRITEGNPEPQTIVKAPAQATSRDVLSIQLRIQFHPLRAWAFNKEFLRRFAALFSDSSDLIPPLVPLG
jgi:hypothetical protein